MINRFRTKRIFGCSKWRKTYPLGPATAAYDSPPFGPWKWPSTRVPVYLPTIAKIPKANSVPAPRLLWVFCSSKRSSFFVSRTVDPDLKSLCNGVASVLVALLALMPAPVFVGAIIDSTCRLWETTDHGGHGSCLLYDTDQYRWKFFLSAGLLRLVASCLDAVVHSTVTRWPFLVTALFVFAGALESVEPTFWPNEGVPWTIFWTRERIQEIPDCLAPRKRSRVVTDLIEEIVVVRYFLLSASCQKLRLRVHKNRKLCIHDIGSQGLSLSSTGTNTFGCDVRNFVD